MFYEYECRNKECKTKDVIVDKPMNKSDRVEKCVRCKEPLHRVYSGSSIKTTDGFKQ